MIGTTEESKLAFLKHYPTFKQIRLTCKAISIGKSIFYRWLKEDEHFRDEVDLLKREIVDDIIEMHEQNIDEVAFNPETKDQSRIFGSLVRLRAEAPDKYREKVPETRLVGDITIKLDIPQRRYEVTEAPKEGKEAVEQGEGEKLTKLDR